MNLPSSYPSAMCRSWPEQRPATKCASVGEVSETCRLYFSDVAFVRERWVKPRREQAALPRGSGLGGGVPQAGRLAGVGREGVPARRAWRRHVWRGQRVQPAELPFSHRAMLLCVWKSNKPLMV